ncbi:MAG: HAD-IA family hydrolase [Flavobacteriaceae bacterium]|nr:HAD-IA family hydrolase [Flavobacteriaceae bacterium]
MIKNIVFDFGDIFINLDKEATEREALAAKINNSLRPELQIYHDYETGDISTKEFLNQQKPMLPNCNEKELGQIWNAIVKDFPLHRLKFIEDLAAAKTHRLFLLSNTNSLHIEKVIENMGDANYNRFQNCFEKFYLSHEIGFRKPNHSIYHFVTKENQLQANETLFIDDTKINTDAAAAYGWHVWNLQPGKDDIVNLFDLDIFKI